MSISSIDPRHIVNGWKIPKEQYCDQPYVVVTKEGDWVCVMTTGRGLEGEIGQHVVATISRDQGKTWCPLIDIEPADGPESSWATPLIVPSSRIYVFYTYNGDNIREIRGGFFNGLPGEQTIKRVDTLGYMVYKYSDDGGKTWSKDRHIIPIRSFAIDKRNRHAGCIQYFWSVGKPVIHQGAVYIGFAKVGEFGHGFMQETEGAFLRSDNILIETNPKLIRWETLPDGDVGLRAPIGPVADEHNLVGLNDGSLYCTYRSVEGYNVHAYSRDRGHTWTKPEYATYSPGGQKIKHPRAANFVKKFSNGNYLLWYHNHGKNLLEGPWLAYHDRNPAWLSGGIEMDGYIYWSQPEIILYDDDPDVRISYPDFFEQNGKYFITETQKEIARVHEIDERLLEGLWSQHNRAELVKEGLLLIADGGTIHDIPTLGDLRERGGFSLDFWICLDDLTNGYVLADSLKSSGEGMQIITNNQGALRLELNDSRTTAFWETDKGILKASEWHHVAVVVDGGPKVILFVVDGILHDGGEKRQFGWGRFNPNLRDVTGSGQLEIRGGTLRERISFFKLYNRALRVSEAVSNYRFGKLSLNGRRTP